MLPNSEGDTESLLGVFRQTTVRRYLLDDAAVSLDWVQDEIASSNERFVSTGAGLWAVRLMGTTGIVRFVGFRELLDPRIEHRVSKHRCDPQRAYRFHGKCLHHLHGVWPEPEDGGSRQSHALHHSGGYHRGPACRRGRWPSGAVSTAAARVACRGASGTRGVSFTRRKLRWPDIVVVTRRFVSHGSIGTGRRVVVLVPTRVRSWQGNPPESQPPASSARHHTRGCSLLATLTAELHFDSTHIRLGVVASASPADRAEFTAHREDQRHAA